MREAIFLPVTGNAEIEIRIGPLSGTAAFALVQRLRGAARIRFKATATRGNIVTVSDGVNDFRPKKDEIVTQRGDERDAVRIRAGEKSGKQKDSRDPGDPLDFDRQNKKQVNDFVRIKGREGVKEG